MPLNVPTERGRPDRDIPPLENGAHLSAREFLRRYEAMPEVKKAELAGSSCVDRRRGREIDGGSAGGTAKR